MAQLKIQALVPKCLGQKLALLLSSSYSWMSDLATQFPYLQNGHNNHAHLIG